MKLVFTSLIILFTATFSFGQSDYPIDFSGFEFIEPTTDTSSLKFIGTFSQKNLTGDIYNLYKILHIQAIEEHANCFKLNSFSRDTTTGEIILMLDAYRGNSDFINANRKNVEKNTVYLFGNFEFNDETISAKIDANKIELKSGHYYKHIIPENGKTRINKGGIAGTSVSLSWKADKTNQYFTFSGFQFTRGKMTVIPIVYPGGMGMVFINGSFTAGKINELTKDFGRLLTMIMKQQQ